MCVTDRHDMTLAVKMALNPNTTKQTFRKERKTNVTGWFPSHQDGYCLKEGRTKQKRYLDMRPKKTEWSYPRKYLTQIPQKLKVKKGTSSTSLNPVSWLYERLSFSSTGTVFVFILFLTNISSIERVSRYCDMCWHMILNTVNLA